MLPELLECPLAPPGQHGVCCPLEAGDVGVTSPAVTPQPLPLRGHECPDVGTCEEEAKSRLVQLNIDSSSYLYLLLQVPHDHGPV